MNQASEPKKGPVLVLLGGTGDLARRMLLPSLFHLEADLRWIDLTAARLSVLAEDVAS